MYENLKTESPTVGDINLEPVIKMCNEAVSEKLKELKNVGSAAKLWIQYFKIVSVALEYIEAERSEDFKSVRTISWNV